MKVNLYDLYKQVKRRVARATFEEEILLAERAAEAAKRIIEKPTLAYVKKFQKAEQRWISLKSKRSVALAHRFFSAIESGDYVIERRFNSLGTGWRPKAGRLYCALSDDLPGQVKIGCVGSTAEAVVLRRLSTVRVKQGLSTIRLLISIEVKDVATVEKDIHEFLESRRVIDGRSAKSREWFHLRPKSAIQMVMSFSRPSRAS